VLSPEWSDELHQASTDLSVRAFELDLDAVTRNDVPVALELLSRARYFTVVLDEDPEGGLPPPISHAPNESVETEDERLQRAPHLARIGIWDLKTESMVLRLRAEAGGEFVAVGSNALTDERSRAAASRQVNSCALALAVKEAIAK
jgi:hypothetical protein